jgi:hypothetical protein
LLLTTSLLLLGCHNLASDCMAYGHQYSTSYIQLLKLRIFALKQLFAATGIFMHQIEYLYSKLCKYFEANMKRMI